MLMNCQSVIHESADKKDCLFLLGNTLTAMLMNCQSVIHESADKAYKSKAPTRRRRYKSERRKCGSATKACAARA